MEKTAVKIAEEVEKRRSGVKPINERIKKLRDQSVTAKVKVSVERAKLITDFYRANAPKTVSYPVLRALAFKCLMENCSLTVEEGQLIVGIRGTGPQEVPTYPEICVHTLDDFETLANRENMPFEVDDLTRKIYAEEVIPFWQNYAMRDIIFQSLPREWIDAYEAGIWTEFMEQRAPGHTSGGSRVFQTWFGDKKENCRKNAGALSG